jgi:hypothetical protein
MYSQFKFQLPTTFTDGTSIPAGTVFTATALIDTVNPPVKSYAVPAATLAAAVAGLVTVPFTAIGLTPTDDVEYFGEVSVAVAGQQSAESPEVTFEDLATPSAPTNPSVS